ETRFELLTLHMFLVLQRLEGGALAQALVEAMVADLDRSLREAGVGDVGVVKRMKHFMQAFYGRLKVYRAALSSSDEKELLRALDKNLYGAVGTDLEKLRLMRSYILRQTAQLKNLSEADFLNRADIFAVG